MQPETDETLYQNTLTRDLPRLACQLSDEDKEAIIAESLEGFETGYCLDCGHPNRDHNYFGDSGGCPQRPRATENLALPGGI